MIVPPGAVDCHAHVMRRGMPMIAERHSEPPRDVEPEEYLAVLDAAGLSHGVLTAPSFYGPDNTLLLKALALAAGRLRGTVILDPAAPPELLPLDQAGVRGVRLNWVARATLPDAGSAAYQRLFAAVRDRGWHIELFLEGEHMQAVLPHLLASGADVVLDHFGHPETLDSDGFAMVLDAVRAGRTWVKLSAPYRLRGTPQPYVDALLAAGGPARLLWASDWPWLGHEGRFSYAACLAWLEDWVPDPATRQTILVDTPGALFGFG